MVCLQGSKIYGEFSNPFSVTNGIKQGCVLAATLFSMVCSAMLTDAFQDRDNGIPIRYRFDGKLFNLRRLQAKSKVQTEVLDKLHFADDIVKDSDRKENVIMLWIKYLINVTAMISQSELKRLRRFISRQLESLIRSLPSQWKVNDCKW